MRRKAQRLALCLVWLAPTSLFAQSLSNGPQLAPQAPAALSSGLMPMFQPQRLPATKGPDKPGADLAFGAYQRGYFRSAFEEATKRLSKNKNDAAAMTLIAEIYRDGHGAKRNLPEAMRWYRLAAERGDRNAMFALGSAALKGDGMERDTQEARQWFEKAAAKGHSGAYYNLGVMTLDNDIQDFQSAAQDFRCAAELGSPDAAYSLAVLYKEGKGVTRDLTQSAHWMSRAAQENITAAIVELAIMTFNGSGVTKDEAQAAKLFRKAALRNNPIAMNRLARLQVAGRGVEKNIIEAMTWHLLARAVGLQDEWLDQTLHALTPAQKDAVENAVRRALGP